MRRILMVEKNGVEKPAVELDEILGEMGWKLLTIAAEDSYKIVEKAEEDEEDEEDNAE